MPVLSADIIYFNTDNAAYVVGSPIVTALTNADGLTTDPNILSPRPVSSSIPAVSLHQFLYLHPIVCLLHLAQIHYHLANLAYGLTKSKLGIFKPNIWSNVSVQYPFPSTFAVVLKVMLNLHVIHKLLVRLNGSKLWLMKLMLFVDGTWFLILDSPNVNTVGCKWVFKVKRHFDRSIEYYKARLVAKGFTNNLELLFQYL